MPRGMAVGFDDMAFGFEGAVAGPPSGDLGGAGEVDGVTGSSDIDGLVAHRGEDFRAEGIVVASSCEAERLDEVALGEAVFFFVVGHPAGEPGQVGGDREQFAAHCFGVGAAQQWRDRAVQVLHHSGPDPAAADPIVEVGERLSH